MVITAGNATGTCTINPQVKYLQVQVPVSHGYHRYRYDTFKKKTCRYFTGTLPVQLVVSFNPGNNVVSHLVNHISELYRDNTSSAAAVVSAGEGPTEISISSSDSTVWDFWDERVFCREEFDSVSGESKGIKLTRAAELAFTGGAGGGAFLSRSSWIAFVNLRNGDRCAPHLRWKYLKTKPPTTNSTRESKIERFYHQNPHQEDEKASQEWQVAVEYRPLSSAL